MYRTHTCGELNIENINLEVTLSGWVQKVRKLGGMTFIDIRDRYGLTQLVFDETQNPQLCEKADNLGREFVIQIKGKVVERSNKNLKIPTGEIEIIVSALEVLSNSEIPPFTIEDETDGGDELRMRYRYLDLRRNIVKKNLVLRHRLAHEIRSYLNNEDFIEIETPVLIKSTPEGARDFVVPSRMNEGQFYALPQSPQVFKQLLMVSGFDKYYQIVKCFRDEDLRADRQPEFTQIDCEMSFVHEEDVLSTFENMIKHLFKKIKNIEFDDNFVQMPYETAMEKYGSDKPDLRFGMEISMLNSVVKNKDFVVFNQAEYVGGICAENCSEFSRKKLDALTKFVQRPQVGAKGLVYLKYNTDGSFKSSVDKFYDENDFKNWVGVFNAKPGDLILILAGKKENTLTALSALRLEMANQLGLRNENKFVPLWVTNFPLLEWDDELQRYFAKHHPFTMPKTEDIALLDTDPGKVRANAYDLVINGVEIGGGSLRIYDTKMQEEMFKHLGFTMEQAKKQFGFLMNAFQYGAPPHGGIALGFDRLVSMFAGLESIRDVIAFPKNNAGRDVMIDSPSEISADQLQELHLSIQHQKI